MTNIYQDNTYSIGRTPIIRLNKIGDGSGATILVKTEGRNPAYSVKCRVGANMIWKAEQSGDLKDGKEIIEPTSGNTGIALAFAGAARGYKVNLTMPETMSMERRKVLIALGANLILTDGSKGMAGAVERAEAIANADPGKYYLPQQFKNPANPEIHEKTTGPEIWDDTGGEVDVIISGVGTGGTITGISRFLKKTKGLAVESVAVEPAESPILTQHLAGETLRPNSHKIQGIGAGFIPDVLDMSVVDKVETVSSEESIEFGRRLAKEEGILAGISSGAAVAVANRLANDPAYNGKTILAILPDAGERYLSSILFEGLFREAQESKMFS